MSPHHKTNDVHEEPGKRFLGFGSNRLYMTAVRPGETLLEEGRCCYATVPEFWCSVCEGDGCTSCKFDGRASAQRVVAAKKVKRAAP